MACRDTIWTFTSNPPKRLRGDPKIGASSDNDHRSLSKLAADTCDLILNLRGVGWSWPNNVRLVLPRETQSSRVQFVLSSLSSLITWYILFDIFNYWTQSLGPNTFGSINGGTIFDYSLPLIQRYLRSSLITIICALRTYVSMPLIHNLLAIIGVLIFRQEPWQWPPMYNEPWLATSLTEFWNLRWHQFFRECFFKIGAAPGAFFFGRVGGIMGGFLLSGLLHHFITWSMGIETEFVPVTCFFLAMGLGNVLEYAFRKFTGRRVQGWLGRIWMSLWLLGWGNIIIDAWCRTGFFGCKDLPSDRRPAVWLFGPLVSVPVVPTVSL